MNGFKELTSAEEQQFRDWAHEHRTAEDLKKCGIYHPVVRDEYHKMGLLPTPTIPIEDELVEAVGAKVSKLIVLHLVEDECPSMWELRNEDTQCGGHYDEECCTKCWGKALARLVLSAAEEYKHG